MNQGQTVETDINKRWENGEKHHPKSVELFAALSEIDLKFGGDYFLLEVWRRWGQRGALDVRDGYLS